MAKKTIRFGVSDGPKLRAATWKLWTETAGGNSELYLTCRSLGGALKASMHQSGQWHIAFSYKTYQEQVEGAIQSIKNRFADKWTRPAEIANGFTLAFRIVTPYTSVTSSRLSGEKNKVIWIPNASESKAIEIDIIITKPNIGVVGWPGKRSMGTSLIGSFQLNNDENVWAIYRAIDMPDSSQPVDGSVHFFKGKSNDDLKGKNLRALAFGLEPDGSRVIYDLVVQQKTS